ncbi:MAG: hypothetical protein ACYSTL_05375 [Planctomycetota bacterium]
MTYINVSRNYEFSRYTYAERTVHFVTANSARSAMNGLIAAS